MTRSEMKTRAKTALGRNLFGENWLWALLVLLVESAIISFLNGLSFLVVGPLSAGIAYVFVKQARDGQAIDFGDMFKGFADDFGGNFLLGLLITIFTALWSLLFVIPGLVKFYSYSMAFYIKNDHPEYGWKECIDGSRQMMRGHKLDLFILDLSFIGWYIVGALCLGIGVLWVLPYHQATRAEFYLSLR